ncbi:MAG: hypothetical protein IJL06_04460 [Kiritimatiellae bacterium]|nr:hypothetical protein [Kiritimatiellia bacterium]
MPSSEKPPLLSVLEGFDSDHETKRQRAVRVTQRIVGIVFGALSVFLVWLIVADARDLGSGAESRLVRIDPAELEQHDPPQNVSWHENENGLFHRRRTVSRSAPLRLRDGVPIVVADARPEETAPFVGRVVADRRAREVAVRLGRPCLFVVRTAQSPFWHFAQLILVFPFLCLVYRLVPFLIPYHLWIYLGPDD